MNFRGKAIVGIIAGGALISMARHGANAGPVDHGTFASQAVDGKEVYLKSCKECHGVLGTPTKASLRKYEKIPDFSKAEFFTKKTDAELLESVEKGKGRDMKGFAEKLSKEEIKAVVAYIHTLAKH